MRNQFFRTLSAWCFKSTLSTYEPTMHIYIYTYMCILLRICTAYRFDNKNVCVHRCEGKFNKNS